MILRNLLGRKARTLLTVFGIAIGVAAVVSLGALVRGLTEAYTTLGGGSGADLLVMQKDAPDIVFSAVDEQVGEVLAGFSDVKQVTPIVYTFAATDEMPYFIVYGYDPDGFAIQRFKIVEGEPLNRQMSHRGGHPLIMGKMAAEDLKKRVGESFRLYEGTYRIVGIYETGRPMEDGGVVVLLEDAQMISGKPHDVNAFLIKVRAGADVEALQQRIEQRFKTLTATTASDVESKAQMLQYLDAFLWAVSMVAILVGGVGVMNTMLMSVVERTREFGVLRAVGWRPRRVMGMVLGESLFLSVVGGSIGVALGVGAIIGVDRLPLGSILVPQTIPPTLLTRGMGIALLLGLLGGALPALRASRLAPVEAMRYEGTVAHVGRHVGSPALRNVLRRPGRTLLTVTGVGIAMLAIVLLGAMSEGMVQAVAGLAVGSGAHLVGMQAEASMDLSQLDERIVRRIASLPGVQAAEGFLTGYATLSDLPFFVVFGYPPRGPGIREYRIVEGDPLSTNHQILLGRVAAQNLHKDLGDTLRIFDSSFKVVGIYETGVPFQDGGGVMTLRDAQRLFGQPHKVSFLNVWLDDPKQAEVVEQEVETRFPEVSLARAAEFTEGLNDLKMMEDGTWGISLMAMVVGGLGMMNTMVMSVIERTREIGVLRALGWRKRRVLGMIVRESITLSLMGGVAGTAAGLVLGQLINTVPAVRGILRMIYSPSLLMQALGTALVLGVIGGLYPAWRAARLQPVEALRYE